MTIMTCDEERSVTTNFEVTTPLFEAAPPLSTIVEAQEGSRDGSTVSDSETEDNAPASQGLMGSDTGMQKPEVQQSVFMKHQEDGEEVVEDILDIHPITHKDIDHGWAYIVFMAMFCIFLISSGLLFTTGQYYVIMLQEFGRSRSYTAWMGSLMNAFFMLGGPLSSELISRYGCRVSIMLGAFVIMMGYVLSAFASSLQTLFITYGVIVACGMNLCYSGQIIALAQYFQRRHTLATSFAMAGIGVGIFLMSQFLAFCIEEFGWRGSFLINAGLGLNMAVFGALVFPLPVFTASEVQCKELKTSQSRGFYMSSDTIRSLHRSRSRATFYEKPLCDRSFSSLKLSAAAGYLSYSLSSLNDRVPSSSGEMQQHHAQFHNSENAHGGIRSNQHSFVSNGYSFSSRGSHHALSGLRSDHPSFCVKGSSAELSELRSNRYSSCSKGSNLGLYSLRTNPFSFSLKGSQGELALSPCQEHPVTELMDAEARDSVRTKGTFFLKDGDGDMSVCDEEEHTGSIFSRPVLQDDSTSSTSLASMLYKHPVRIQGPYICEENEEEVESPYCGGDNVWVRPPDVWCDRRYKKCIITGVISDQAVETDDVPHYVRDQRRCVMSPGSREDYSKDSEEEDKLSYHNDIPKQSFCTWMIENIKLRSRGAMCMLPSVSKDHPLLDIRFWLMDFACFFCMLGTLTINVIYKDFTNYLGLKLYYTMAASGIGIGDISGRLLGGFLTSLERVDAILCYGVAMFFSGIVILVHPIINNGIALIALTTTFGVLYGGQNVLIAVAPAKVFGRDKLVTVFGHILFLSGIGALIGSPFAGWIVDISGSYNGVIAFSVTSCFIGGILMFICYIIHRRKISHENSKDSKVQEATAVQV